MAAKPVAPGHLKIKDESLGVYPKKAISIVKSKNSKKYRKKGGSRIADRKRKALNDTSKKKSPQPEASLKEDINIDEENPSHDIFHCVHCMTCMCKEEKEPEMVYSLVFGLPIDSDYDEFSKNDCTPNLEQIKVPGSPQCSSPEPIEATSEPIIEPLEFADWFSEEPLSQVIL